MKNDYLDNIYMVEIRKVRESSNGRLELSDWTWEAYAYNKETEAVMGEEPLKELDNKLFLSKALARIPFDGPLHLSPRDHQSYAIFREGKIRQVGSVNEDNLAEIICTYVNEREYIKRESKDL